MYKIFILILLSNLILILSGCYPSKYAIAPSMSLSKVSFLNESDAKCELKLKSYIQDHGVKFTPLNNLAFETNLANEIVIENSEEKLTLREQNLQFIEYQHITNFKNKDYSGERTSSLGLNEKDSFYLMYFETSLKTKTDKEVKTLSQRYGVNNKNNLCQLELIKSSVMSFTKETEPSTFKYKIFSISKNQEILSDVSKVFKIENGQELSEFTPEVKNYDQIFEHQNNVLYIPEIGIVEIKILPTETTNLSILGDFFKFKSVEIKTFNGGKELFSLTSGFDELQDASYSNTLGTISYTLPFNKYFPKVQLGEEYISLGTQNSNLDYDYQIHSSKLKLFSNNKLSYDSFAAYWNILDEKFNENTKQYQYSLQENPNPQIFRKTTNEDLTNNSTIQVDLPEIIEIANSIEKNYGPDRKSKIKGILEYLSLNYKYDFDMLNQMTIRPLTAKEALERKKGVCQHYAILFTTIARALKIPSRIIWGYLINGKNIGSHAWVEVETDENIWRVVEPQNINGLTDTHTRFYFPLSRATFLENKEQLSPEAFSILISNRYEFLKAN